MDNSRLNRTETLRQAQELISLGRLSAAISIYKKIVDGDSSDLTAVSTLGELYVKAGRVQEAVDHFVRVAADYLSSGSANSAAYVLNKAIKLDPANASAHQNLGELYLLEMKIDRQPGPGLEPGIEPTGNRDVGSRYCCLPTIRVSLGCTSNKPITAAAQIEVLGLWILE